MIKFNPKHFVQLGALYSNDDCPVPVLLCRERKSKLLFLIKRDDFSTQPKEAKIKSAGVYQRYTGEYCELIGFANTLTIDCDDNHNQFQKAIGAFNQKFAVYRCPITQQLSSCLESIFVGVVEHNGVSVKCFKKIRRRKKENKTHNIFELNSTLNETSTDGKPNITMIETPKQCTGLVFKALISDYANTKGYYVHRETLKVVPTLSCSCPHCDELIQEFYNRIANYSYPEYDRPLIHQKLYNLIPAAKNDDESTLHFEVR